MTQGMVTVMRGGVVAMKIVVGSNGMNGRKLAQDIVHGRLQISSIESTYRRALALGFGAADCLVVVTADAAMGPTGDCIHDLPMLYREALADPRFNPRWECGLCEYLWLVEMEPKPHLVTSLTEGTGATP